MKLRGVANGLCALALTAYPLAAETGSATPVLTNGTFEVAASNDARRPAGWDLPDGLGVQWMEAEGRGRVIAMDTRVSEQRMVEQWRSMGIDRWDIPKPAADPIAATYGLSYYSERMPVVSGAVYRVRFDFQGPGSVKVWVRGYGPFRGEQRRRYEMVVHGADTGGQWRTFEAEFSPTARRPEVNEMAVMLYAYWPPGVYRFDNVRLERLAPP